MNKIAGRPANKDNSAAKTASSEQNTTHKHWVPKCLRSLIPSDYDTLKWRRLSPSISCTELCRDIDGSKVELLRIRPGGSSGTHTHLNEELTVILEGSFSDEHGVYREGDYVCMDSRHKHTPVATRDKACICLVVTKAPVQFTGFFSRLLNPLLRRSYA
jgi:putative transcriptional regulator